MESERELTSSELLDRENPPAPPAIQGQLSTLMFSPSNGSTQELDEQRRNHDAPSNGSTQELDEQRRNHDASNATPRRSDLRDDGDDFARPTAKSSTIGGDWDDDDFGIGRPAPKRGRGSPRASRGLDEDEEEFLSSTMRL